MAPWKHWIIINYDDCLPIVSLHSVSSMKDLKCLLSYGSSYLCGSRWSYSNLIWLLSSLSGHLFLVGCFFSKLDANVKTSSFSEHWSWTLKSWIDNFKFYVWAAAKHVFPFFTSATLILMFHFIISLMTSILSSNQSCNLSIYCTTVLLLWNSFML